MNIDGGCLSHPILFAIDTAADSHWESVNKTAFCYSRVWCKLGKMYHSISHFWMYNYLNDPIELNHWRLSCRPHVYSFNRHWYYDGLASRARRKIRLTPLVNVLTYSLIGWKPNKLWIMTYGWRLSDVEHKNWIVSIGCSMRGIVTRRVWIVITLCCVILSKIHCWTVMSLRN